MSYVRWSTTLPITEACSNCGREPTPEIPGESHEQAIDRWIKQHMADMVRWKGTHKDGTSGLCRSCTSPWYIYWDCSSGDERDTQLLAVWATSNSEYPLLDYPTLREMADVSDYSDIPGFDTDGDPYGVLSDSIKAWLEEVENEFPAVETQ